VNGLPSSGPSNTPDDHDHRDNGEKDPPKHGDSYVVGGRMVAPSCLATLDRDEPLNQLSAEDVRQYRGMVGLRPHGGMVGRPDSVV
jgi:hypothetical protein